VRRCAGVWNNVELLFRRVAGVDGRRDGLNSEGWRAMKMLCGLINWERKKERGTLYHTAATGPIVDWGSLIICLGVITVQKFRMSKLVKISKPIGGNFRVVMMEYYGAFSVMLNPGALHDARTVFL
jgi:hypothetical protein